MRNTREHVSTRRSRKQVRDRLEFSLSPSLSLALPLALSLDSRRFVQVDCVCFDVYGFGCLRGSPWPFESLGLRAISQ